MNCPMRCLTDVCWHLRYQRSFDAKNMTCLRTLVYHSSHGFLFDFLACNLLIRVDFDDTFQTWQTEKLRRTSTISRVRRSGKNFRSSSSVRLRRSTTETPELARPILEFYTVEYCTSSRTASSRCLILGTFATNSVDRMLPYLHFFWTNGILILQY